MSTEGLFRYKGIKVKPSPKPLAGENHGQWSGDYALEFHTGPEVVVKFHSVPGIFSSEGEALAAIIPHARHTIDTELGEDRRE